MATPRNSKDSMVSTWRSKKSEWTPFHWFFEILGIHHVSLDQKVPVHEKTEPVPYVPHWSQHRYILSNALLPLLVHQLYVYYVGRNFGPLAAFGFYSIAFKLIGIHHLHHIRHMGHLHGFLDGDKHERDGVPDNSVSKVFFSLISTSTFRSTMSIILAYRTSQTPFEMNWLVLPLEVGLYGVILDFWFYWYHRLMHEVDSLWQYHRTHHLTKHPNPLLTLFADTEQEFFDIAGIPIMTFLTLKLLGFPMGFYEWWICQQYVVYTELSGHSGLRIYATAPSPFALLLRMFDAELVLEDHDLHHRKGWKASGNYGKHSRLWDRIFGTLIPRIECTDNNIDYVNMAVLPLL